MGGDGAGAWVTSEETGRSSDGGCGDLNGAQTEGPHGDRAGSRPRCGMRGVEGPSDLRHWSLKSRILVLSVISCVASATSITPSKVHFLI